MAIGSKRERHTMSLPEKGPLALEKREFAKFCSSPDSSLCLPCDCCALTFAPCVGGDKTHVRSCGIPSFSLTKSSWRAGVPACLHHSLGTNRLLELSPAGRLRISGWADALRGSPGGPASHCRCCQTPAIATASGDTHTACGPDHISFALSSVASSQRETRSLTTQ